jgi:hypothetical protein
MMPTVPLLMLVCLFACFLSVGYGYLRELRTSTNAWGHDASQCATSSAQDIAKHLLGLIQPEKSWSESPDRNIDRKSADAQSPTSANTKYQQTAE